MDLAGWAAAKILTTRGLARAPIPLYRHGLGWLFGGRLLMLEHTGRTSGLPRQVCLEVVARPDRDHVVVASGLGTRSQWYRNLAAHAECRVSIGRRSRVTARARMMSQAESADALLHYSRAHPRTWKRLRSAIEQAVGHPVDTLPMVELTLSSSGP